MNGLGLSPEALERRRGYICASDAKDIMEGNWPLVYGRKVLGEDDDDLSGVLPVQLGSYTEPFCFAWYMQQTGRPVNYFTDSPMLRDIWKELTGQTVSPEFWASDEHPFMGCSLDAISTTSSGFPCVLDAKHVGTFSHDKLVERYTAAGVHQSVVCNTDWWCLAVLIGNGKFEVIEQEVDVFYRERLISREREFWSWVEANTEPPDMRDPVAPPPPQPKLRRVEMPMFTDPAWQDFIQRNNWAVDAANAIMDFIGTDGAAKKHAISREAIKSLVPEDVGELTRGNFVLKRSRANAVTTTLEKSDG